MTTRGDSSKSRHAFTLIELLVVLGIIAILVAVLLPVLSSVRRQANQLKCLASLKEIGNAIKLYAHEHKDAWPVAVHHQGPYTAGVPLLPEERRWYDLLAKYVSGSRNINQSADIALIRRNSAIWGCPEWTMSSEYDPNSALDKLRVGYAMQYHPMIDENFDVQNFAYIGPTVVGRYVKGTIWRRHSSERAVIGCSPTHIVPVPLSFSRSTSAWMPFESTDPSKPLFMFDATRHLKRGTGKAASARQKGLNMLFADGRAAPVSIVEAWNAVRCPGQDQTNP